MVPSVQSHLNKQFPIAVLRGTWAQHLQNRKKLEGGSGLWMCAWFVATHSEPCETPVLWWRVREELGLEQTAGEQLVQHLAGKARLTSNLGHFAQGRSSQGC